MDPYRLSVWVSISANYKIFMPSTQAILERYMAKFSKGRQINLDDDEIHTACGLVDKDADNSEPEAAYGVTE